MFPAPDDSETCGANPVQATDLPLVDVKMAMTTSMVNVSELYAHAHTHTNTYTITISQARPSRVSD